MSVVTSFPDFYGCLFKTSVKKNSNPPDALHELRMYGKNVFLTVISQWRFTTLSFVFVALFHVEILSPQFPDVLNMFLHINSFYSFQSILSLYHVTIASSANKQPLQMWVCWPFTT